MSIFGKKKEAPSNPYNNPDVITQQMQSAQSQQVIQPPLQSQTQNPQVQSNQAAISSPVNTSVDQQTSQNNPPFNVPILPVPEPLNNPNIELTPLKAVSAAPIVSSLEPKAMAFVKLSNFKQVLDDIKELNDKISESQQDLENLSAQVKQQESDIERYRLMLGQLKKTIDDITASLSDVQE